MELEPNEIYIKKAYLIQEVFGSIYSIFRLNKPQWYVINISDFMKTEF